VTGGKHYGVREHLSAKGRLIRHFPQADLWPGIVLVTCDPEFTQLECPFYAFLTLLLRPGLTASQVTLTGNLRPSTGQAGAGSYRTIPNDQLVSKVAQRRDVIV